MLYNEVNCVHFLTELFTTGKSYSSINSARSALSTFLINCSGTTIGNSPSVKRFLKGVFELRPPSPRINVIWDISIVLDFLSFYFPLEDIPLSVLTFKCVVLLALSSMQRVQTLHAIDISCIKFLDNSVFIPINKLLKQSSAKNYKFSLYLKSYKDNPSICPCLTLKHYINKTKVIRGNHTQLFISFQKPYEPVTRSTLSRWIKRVLEESGIDVGRFSAHSTRSAAASAAREDDMPVDDILRIGGWANARVFQKFYSKVIEQ